MSEYCNSQTYIGFGLGYYDIPQHLEEGKIGFIISNQEDIDLIKLLESKEDEMTQELKKKIEDSYLYPDFEFEFIYNHKDQDGVVGFGVKINYHHNQYGSTLDTVEHYVYKIMIVSKAVREIFQKHGISKIPKVCQNSDFS